MVVTLESRYDIHTTAEVVTQTLALLWKLQILSFTCEAHAPACNLKDETNKKSKLFIYQLSL